MAYPRVKMETPKPRPTVPKLRSWRKLRRHKSPDAPGWADSTFINALLGLRGPWFVGEIPNGAGKAVFRALPTEWITNFCPESKCETMTRAFIAPPHGYPQP